MSRSLQIYNQGDNLKLPNNNMTIVVINLTKKYASYVSHAGLPIVIQALNHQVQHDFAPIWGPSATLVDKTLAFGIHLTSSQNAVLTSANFDQIGNALVDWIVKTHSDGTFNWNNTGIVYLVDNVSEGFGGVHMDEKIQHFDIPWSLVTVEDQNWTVTLSHEVLELLADPWGTRFVKQNKYPVIGWKEQDWIIEVCDACEDTGLAYQSTGGVLVSDFVVPAYFNISTPTTTALDFRGHLFRNTDKEPVSQFPFPILPQGYLSFINPTTNQFAQITWFGAAGFPSYTRPEGGDNASHSIIGRHCGSRLDKYFITRQQNSPRRARYLGPHATASPGPATNSGPQIYNQNDDLTLPQTNTRIIVIDLTQRAAPYVAHTGLANAIAALNTQVNRDFAPKWGPNAQLEDHTEQFHIHLSASQNATISSANPIQLINALVDYIVQNSATIDWHNAAIAYLTDGNQQPFGGVHLDEKTQAYDIPWCVVAVRNASWSIAFSHEILEMLADPWGQRFMRQNQYRIDGFSEQDWIIEVCDACEDNSLAYVINGVQVSDFVLPAYFRVSTSDATPLDFRGHLLRNTQLEPRNRFPYPILSGGYLSFFSPTSSHLYQITWFKSNGPIYITVPESGTGSAIVGKGCDTRLSKYIEHHRGCHDRRARYLGLADVGQQDVHHVVHPHHHP